MNYIVHKIIFLIIYYQIDKNSKIFCNFNIKMNKEDAVNDLKYRLLIKINNYYDNKNKNKLKSGRPKTLTNGECLDAIFL